MNTFTVAPAVEPTWVILRIDAVQVALNRPGTSQTWDGPAPEQGHGEECALLGLGIGIINPILGKGAHLLCKMETRPKQRERDVSAPDLAVRITAGMGAVYQTATAWDTGYHIFRQEFMVPTEAIPAEGLSLSVVDRDGGEVEVIGAVRLSRQQLVSAITSGQPMMVLQDPSGGLIRLELVVSASSSEGEDSTFDIDASDGTVRLRHRPIRAGEVVELSAVGRYQIGSHYDEWLGPTGYPGGGPKSYNFDAEPFKGAAHGAALAIVGDGDAKQGLLVTPCATTISRSGGQLVVGVNDAEPDNNRGSLRFTIRVRPPTVQEWLARSAPPCSAF